jgi:hypothetical protein
MNLAAHLGMTSIDLRELIPGAPLPGGVFSGLIYTSGVAEAIVVGPEYDGTADHQTLTDWAAALTVDEVTGFQLPFRSWQSLAFAYVPQLFKRTWYASCERSPVASNLDGCQGFYDGGQDGRGNFGILHARAFRTLALDAGRVAL